MSRVLKVMAVLVVLTMMSSVSVQTAYAVDDNYPTIAGDVENGPDVMEGCTEPIGGGEGDPDTVGGGYGAQSGDSDLSDFLGGIIGGLTDTGATIEAYINYMLMQFIPVP